MDETTETDLTTEVIEESTSKPNDGDATKEELARLRQQNEAIMRQLNSLKNVQQPSSPPVQPPAQQVDMEQLKAEFWKNPLQMSAMMAQRAKESATAEARQMWQQVQEAMGSMVRDKFATQFPELFEKYGHEIDELVSHLDPAYRTNATVWGNILDQIRGRHMNELALEREKKSQAVGAPGMPGIISSTGNKRKTDLTEMELKAAEIFDLTPDEYRRGKEDYANQSAAWDRVLTRSNIRRKKEEVKK